MLINSIFINNALSLSIVMHEPEIKLNMLRQAMVNTLNRKYYLKQKPD